MTSFHMARTGNRVVTEKIRIFPIRTLNNKGFTLIELTVVVFLVTIMLLIAVPRVRDAVLTDDLQSTVNRLTNTARELRARELQALAGLPHLRTHDLRHQCASFLVNSVRPL